MSGVSGRHDIVGEGPRGYLLAAECGYRLRVRTAATDSADHSSRARRRSKARPPFSWRRLPLVVWVLAGSAVCGLGWSAYRSYRAGRVEIAFVRTGAPVPDLQLTFYPQQLAFAAPSPPPPIGEHRLKDGNCFDVGRDLVPERAVVRYEGAGVGTGFVCVELGKAAPPIELHEARTLRGRVGEPKGFWSSGWRCAGFDPVAGAEVFAMGGGEHGIVLASGRTDADGRFELPGIDGHLTSLEVRVRAAGFTLAHMPMSFDEDGATQIVPMTRTTAMKGRILAPPEVDLSKIRVLARGLPGVEATPAADGSFELDHVAPDTEPRLVLHGLAAGWTHAPARAVRSRAVQIRIVPGATVRGRVVDETTQDAMGGVLVSCGDAATVRADASGRFELSRLMPGDAEVVAQWQSSGRGRTRTRIGRLSLVLVPGQVVDDCVVSIEPDHSER